MMRTRHLFPLLSLLLLPALPAQARDNTRHSVGIGFQTTPTPGVVSTTGHTQLSLKIAAAPEAEFSVLTGFSGADGFFSLSFGAKAQLTLVPEEQMNLYMAAMVLPAVGTGGFQSMHWFLGPGVAYYLPGAENLEIFGEFGLGGAVIDDGAGILSQPFIQTAGKALVGLHYWF